MDTPIVDFVKRYSTSGKVRFHMPGHKGIAYLGCEPLDITEISGADSLYEADGIIAESESNATKLFGFGHTFYSTEGSSQCIKAMLYLALQQAICSNNKSRLILAARNVHKAFIHAAALLDLEVEWIYPETQSNSLCSCKIEPENVDRMLDTMTVKPFAVYLTAPDYLGYSPDIAKISKVCASHGVLLLVDNAHGAYLKFLPESRHPVDLGAFMSTDSAHKTLPVLTGGAYLQLSCDVPEKIAANAKNALMMFGSTSPSYLILQSLDLCCRYISEGYREKLAELISLVNTAKEKLNLAGWNVLPSDPLKITIGTECMGYTGKQVGEYLGSQEIECEFADLSAVVIMVTPENTEIELDRLVQALTKLPRIERSVEKSDIIIPRGLKAVSIREAFFSPHESVLVTEAEGRICASATVSCPPAIPIAVSGEIISKESISLFQAYGIDFIDVIV
jgi:arginine decarboxylase